MAEEIIFHAKGQYSTDCTPPILACRNCRAVMRPGRGVTSIKCRCGKTYTLMAEGVPVQKIVLK